MIYLKKALKMLDQYENKEKNGDAYIISPGFNCCV